MMIGRTSALSNGCVPMEQRSGQPNDHGGTIAPRMLSPIRARPSRSGERLLARNEPSPLIGSWDGRFDPSIFDLFSSISFAATGLPGPFPVTVSRSACARPGQHGRADFARRGSSSSTGMRRCESDRRRCSQIDMNGARLSVERGGDLGRDGSEGSLTFAPPEGNRTTLPMRESWSRIGRRPPCPPRSPWRAPRGCAQVAWTSSAGSGGGTMVSRASVNPPAGWISAILKARVSARAERALRR